MRLYENKFSLATARKDQLMGPYDDSPVLHCASLLRTIFASLARANERVHVYNERDFPQAKLACEINVRFLLNKHRKVPFLLH